MKLVKCGKARRPQAYGFVAAVLFLYNFRVGNENDNLFGLLSRGTYLDGKINKKSPQDRAWLLLCLVGLAVQNHGNYGVLLCGAVDGLMLTLPFHSNKTQLYRLHDSVRLFFNSFLLCHRGFANHNASITNMYGWVDEHHNQDSRIKSWQKEC